MLTSTINVNFSGDWFSAVINALMLVVAIASAFYAYKAYTHQKERSKKAAACDLAKYYAEVVLEKYSLIANVFKYSELDAYIKKTICLNEIERFDREELEMLLKAKNVDVTEFLSKLEQIDPFVVLNCRASRTCSVQERVLAYGDYVSQNSETGELEIVNGAFLVMHFFQEVSDMLNQLEWFSMNCHYGLADEELLYQSLHQTFISTVWVLYPYISKNNINNEDKFYTNLIWLFNTWKNRLSGIKEEAEKRKQQYLAQANAAKPRIFEGQGIK